VTCFTGVGILKDTIDLFGGIRFRYMNPFDMVGMRLLLDACAETLETLRLHPTDPRGKELSPSGLRVLTGDFTGVSSIRDFDLSRNRFLQTLEVTAHGIVCALCQAGSLGPATGPFAYALSTITSPAFTEVAVFYQDYDFFGVVHSWPDFSILHPLSPGHIAEEVSCFDRRFKVFREMRKIRGFQLVLCADTWDGVGEYTVGVLKQAVAAEKVKTRFDGTFLEPLVIHRDRVLCSFLILL